jgi:hypothetical protein
VGKQRYMKKTLLLLYILTPFCVFSQTTKIKIKKEKEEKVKPKIETENRPHGVTIDLYYGNRVFKKNYYDQFNSTKKLDLNSPPRVIGIGFSGYNTPVNRNLNFVSQGNYYKILPVNIYISDSLKTKFSGYVLGLGLGFGISTLNRNLSMDIYVGFNTGRTTLSKNEFISQKNQFFSPKVSVQPKIIIKRIAISLMVEAEFDVTNPAWKQTIFEKKEPHLLQPFNQTCITGLVGLGYRLSKS